MYELRGGYTYGVSLSGCPGLQSAESTCKQHEHMGTIRCITIIIIIIIIIILKIIIIMGKQCDTGKAWISALALSLSDSGK